MSGELSGLSGQSSKGSRSPSQRGESYTKYKSEYKSLSECQSVKNLFKEIGDIDDSNLASSKNLAESTDKVGVNNTNKDSQKHTENSEISSSFMTGKLSGLGGKSSKGRRSPSQRGESYTEDKSEYKSATQPTNSSASGARRHYNPRIADALKNMVGMGFADDDGWLTQLLVMEHGDISQVLDILTPVKSNHHTNDAE